MWSAWQTGFVSARGDRLCLYFAVILEFVREPGADSLLGEQWRGGGFSFIFPASTHSVWPPDMCNAVSVYSFLCRNSMVFYD